MASLLDKLKDSVLGLAGLKPSNFGVNPIPPDSLHDSYSVDGKPDVRWRSSNGLGFKPQPSSLDELDPKAPKLTSIGIGKTSYKSKAGQNYKDKGPKGGRY
jgi:hypothetical protein